MDCPDDGSPCEYSYAEDQALWSWIEALQARIDRLERYAARVWRFCGKGSVTP